MTHPPIEWPRPGRKHRSWLQRREDHELAQHSYRVEMVGGLGALRWPSLCAACGADSDDRLVVRKVFVRPRSRTRRGSSYRRHVIASAHVPYCASCTERHRALVPQRSLARDAWNMLWPVLIPMFGSGWFFLLSSRIALEEQRHGSLAFKYVWGVPALFGLIFLWCIAIGWWSSRVLRVERQTDVTRACDFSDDVSWPWERERRIYALANERFARALADANAHRLWTTDDDRRSSRTFNAALVIGAIAIAVVWALVVLAPL